VPVRRAYGHRPIGLTWAMAWVGTVMMPLALWMLMAPGYQAAGEGLRRDAETSGTADERTDHRGRRIVPHQITLTPRIVIFGLHRSQTRPSSHDNRGRIPRRGDYE